MTVPRAIRRFTVCYLFQLKVLATSPFEGLLSLIFPLLFATSTLMVYRLNPDPDALVYASVGATAMGVWTAMMAPAGDVLNRERWQGTLELMVAAPTSFSMALLPIMFAMATIGLYSVVATFVWVRFVFGVELAIDNPAFFILSVLSAAVSMALVGFVLAVTVVRYRTAWALGAALDYPGWLLCGFVVPISVLPAFVQPVSWALAPTWAVRAMRISVTGGTPWFELLVCGLLACAYAVLGGLLGRRLIDSARREATLALT